MKLKSTLLAATLVVFATSSGAALAAEAHPADAPARGTPVGTPLLHSDPSAVKAEKTEAVKTENGEARRPVKKKVKRHSHLEEKTGMPMPEPVPAEGKVMPKNRHDHTRDRY